MKIVPHDIVFRVNHDADDEPHVFDIYRAMQKAAEAFGVKCDVEF